MSENYSESCYTSSNECAINTCDAETRKERTGKLAAVALGTALLLSLIGAFNLDRDVKLVTNDEVPYINQRIENIAPSYVAAVNKIRTEKGM
jgi:hypothetical protein